jgi:hypothetical protein
VCGGARPAAPAAPRPAGGAGPPHRRFGAHGVRGRLVLTF